MAHGPITYRQVMDARLAWAAHPQPTDNAISDLEEMAQQDPTLFEGPDGAEAREKLREAAALIKNNAADKAQRTADLLLDVFSFLLDKLAPARPAFPPRHGGRRRRTRGRKTRRLHSRRKRI